MRVQHGSLTFYPQPPQYPTTLKPGLVLLERGSSDCYAALGCKSFIPCPNEAACFSAGRVFTVLGTLDQLQFALENRYITYLGDLYYYGPDTLSVPPPPTPHPRLLGLLQRGGGTRLWGGGTRLGLPAGRAGIDRTLTRCWAAGTAGRLHGAGAGGDESL